jgi:hypothetical protein
VKVFVVAPAGHATGGVEALHQLVDALLRLGADAYISYWPPRIQSAVTPQYQNYGIRTGPAEDVESSVVIIPEVMLVVRRNFRRARIAIWWLSIDFYFGRAHRSVFEDSARLLWRVINRRVVSFGSIRGLLHFAQSCYARDYLARYGLRALMLTDYLNASLTEGGFGDGLRSPVVLYNPAKGLGRTKMIIEASPSVRFVPIQGYSRLKVLELFRSSAVYIDFGHHPGKDRMPREAAINGCVVVTNRRGSAGNEFDVRLPDELKVDDDSPEFAEHASRLLMKIMMGRERYVALMNEYVESIRAERMTFDSEVGSVLQRLTR